jgi:transposase
VFELSPDGVEYLKLMRNQEANRAVIQPKLILDFGDAWFLEHVMNDSGLKMLFRKILPGNADTLLALISFKLLDNATNSYARVWLEGSYARYLYPGAQLASQRISEFMDNLGQEENMRLFWGLYFAYLKKIPGLTDNILIDSTGVPNDIHFDYAALSNHNGVISREARLIFVVERSTSMPVYFRYVAGNIVDVSTLKTTLNQLKAQGVDIKHGIMDAGYCSGNNIRDLYKQDIPFLIRLPDKSMSNDLIKQHGSELYSTKYVLRYGNRIIFMKQVPTTLYDYPGFAYIAIDVERQQDEQKHYINKCMDNPKMKAMMSDDELKAFGYFVLISSQDLRTEEVLPLYYMRQTIEQTFDYTKNDVDLLPLRSHNEDTFRGHLLLSFMATILFITVNKRLKSRKKLDNICVKKAFHAFRRIKCNVYPSILVHSEADKTANLILKELKLTMPQTINL